jgi:VWFA-related protein
MRSAILASIAAGLTLSVAVVLTAQERQTPPVFKAGTEIVLVDFVVTDKSDNPVKGLAAGDFVVKEDGKDRPIVSFAAFADGGPASTQAATRPPQEPAGAATAFLVDDIQLTPEQTLRLRPDLKAVMERLLVRKGRISLGAPASRMFEALMLPADATALASTVDGITGHRLENQSDLPIADAEAIAIDRGDQTMVTRLTGRFMALNSALKENQAEALARNRATEVSAIVRMRRDQLYKAASLAFDWLSEQPGRHNLVVVSPGFPRDVSDTGYNDIVTRSLRVNAPISFVDVRGLPGFGPYNNVTFGAALGAAIGEAPGARTDAAAGTAVLADDTGGVIIRNTNDLQAGLGRLLDSMTAYYVIGYERVVQPKSGFRNIRVETRAKGFNIRARRGYFDTVDHK